jgi:protein gp37
LPLGLLVAPDGAPNGAQLALQLSTKVAAPEKVPNTASVQPPTDLGLCFFNTRVMARERAGRPRSSAAALRFLSIEPLLEDLGLFDLTWINRDPLGNSGQRKWLSQDVQ